MYSTFPVLFSSLCQGGKGRSKASREKFIFLCLLLTLLSSLTTFYSPEKMEQQSYKWGGLKSVYRKFRVEFQAWTQLLSLCRNLFLTSAWLNMLIKSQNSFLFRGVLHLNFYLMVNIFILITVLQALMFVPTLNVLRVSETICCWLCLCFSLFFIFVIFNLWFVLYSFHYYALISYLESLHRETISSVWHLSLHFELYFHNRQSLIHSFVAELLFLKLFYIFLYNFLNVFTLLHKNFK